MSTRSLAAMFLQEHIRCIVEVCPGALLMMEQYPEMPYCLAWSSISFLHYRVFPLGMRQYMVGDSQGTTDASYDKRMP